MRFIFILALLVIASNQYVEAQGILVESTEVGSALQVAGVLPGDHIISWERPPNPPWSPEEEKGVLSSYFDWEYLKAEQAPRGPILLQIRRGESFVAVRAPLGSWQSEVRPLLEGDAEKIFLRGRELHESGNLDGAVREWKSLVDQRTLSGDLKTWCALFIAEILLKQKRYKEGVHWTHEALRFAAGMQARISTLVIRGKILRAWGKPKEAESAFVRALRIDGLSKRKLTRGALLLELANIGRDSGGKVSQAIALATEARLLFEELAPSSLQAGEALRYLGNLVIFQGDLPQAASLLEKAIAICNELHPFGTEIISAQNELGLAYLNLGEYGRAELTLLEALSRARNWIHDNDLGMSINNSLGLLYLTLGKPERAWDYFVESLRLSDQIGRLDKRATILNNLGLAAWNRAELDRAMEFFKEALDIRRESFPGTYDLASSLNNVGLILLEKEDFAEAAGYLTLALEILDREHENSMAIVSVLSNLSTAADKLGRSKLALEYGNRALKIVRDIAPASLDVANVLSILAVIDSVNKKRAMELIRESIEIREALAPGSLDILPSLDTLAMAYERLGQSSEAVAVYDRMFQLLENSTLGTDSAYAVQVALRSYYGGFVGDYLKLLVDGGREIEAFGISERWRVRVLMNMIYEKDLAKRNQIPDEIAEQRMVLAKRNDELLSTLDAAVNSSDVVRLNQARADLMKVRNAYDDLERKTRESISVVGDFRRFVVPPVVDIQSQLDPGTIFLSYFVTKERTLVFSFERESGLRVVEIEVGEEELTLLIEDFRRLVEESGSVSLSGQRMLQMGSVSQKLYSLLFGPFHEQLILSSRVLLVPSGVLHYLPFSALATSDDSGKLRYLAEWRSVHVALSVSAFLELKNRRLGTGLDSPDIKDIVAFGDPNYFKLAVDLNLAARLPGESRELDGPLVPPLLAAAERGVSEWGQLKYSRNEVERISRLFPSGKSQVFLGPEATEERVKLIGPGVRILHIAAHSRIDEHLPMNSFIALSIPEEVSSPSVGTSQGNGLLQVWEIFDGVRLDAELVVLSACDSGLGKELGAEGILGLTRAFQYAGARSVLASLWSVADATTAELMVRFYRHLRSGLPKADALRAAQLELIRGPITIEGPNGPYEFDASSPYYWAAFQLYGDWK